MEVDASGAGGEPTDTTGLFRSHRPARAQLDGFRFIQPGKSVTHEIGPANQDFAIFPEAELIFPIRKALDLGNQQSEGLKRSAPIEQVVVGKIEHHFNRYGARNNSNPVMEVTGNALRLDVELA